MPTPVFVVRADADRHGHPINFLNGRFDTKITSSDSDGALLVIDTVRTGSGGPPLHYHHDIDETFFVQEGAFRFRVGDEFFELRPGDMIFGPRRVPHAFRNTTATGRLMVMFRPAGTMEAFFTSQMLDPMSEQFRQLSRLHGMEVVGPPLPA
ncbi:cupin domain-containing protein [Devosia sp. 2618]|uniref:cupin domain-containing protein n=1 Tax=Devosia sp. 2618 TaxID=3156454 RepID=UPI003395955A